MRGDGLRAEYGLTFYDGPGFSGLFTKKGAHVLRGGEVVAADLPFSGGHAEFNFWKQGHPCRPDGAAMLVGHKHTLYELTLQDAVFRRISEIERVMVGKCSYLPSGAQSAHSVKKSVLLTDLKTGEVTPVHEMNDTIVGVEPLWNGHLAVLSRTLLRILDAESFAVVEEHPWKSALSIGTLDAGRVLVVGRRTSWANDRHGSTYYAVRDKLAELHRGSVSLLEIYDARGRQYVRTDRVAMEVLGTRHALESLAAS